MDNGTASKSHPFWSLSTEALNAQATPAIPAQHGSECACRHCASGGYSDLLQTSDYQRHEIARLTAELARVKFALSIEKYRRLTLVIEQAVAAGDKETWAVAVRDRMDLGVAVQMAVMEGE